MKYIFAILLLVISSYSFSQPKNLVMEGGGVRGIAYVGAIQALEEANLLKEIENISGTSVGGITAAFLCVGYTADELRTELSSLKIQKFNDGKGIFIGGISRTNKRFGWYRGEKLTEWVNNLLEKKTGIKDLTFEQLSDLAATSSEYKNLYVTATNLTQQNWQIISYKNYPNMRVADGIRISASIPLYYSAIFIDKQGNLYEKPPKDTPTEVLVDGGFLANYPIQIFDDVYNKNETIGLRLDESYQIEQDTCGHRELAPYQINDFKDYVGAFYNLVIENLNRAELTEEDWERTISISTCGIGPRVKKLPESDIETLINSGYTAVKEFLTNSKTEAARE